MTQPESTTDLAASLQEHWDQLLTLSNFSLDPFAMMVNQLQVRIYHAPSRTIYFFDKVRSREQMQQVCHALGYSLDELVRQNVPKS